MSLKSLDLPGKPENTRVVVAMSGGVDSSVVAGLLKHAGYEVIGITLQLYNYGSAIQLSSTCCTGKDVDDARKVCEILDIPHYVLDYKARFHERVIIPFVESYSLGETPVPCIACNQSVKFTDLLQTSKALGADALATGHYVRSIANGSHRALFRPTDSDRDQSYFLFSTTQEQIDYLRFPLGDFQKHYVRKLAKTMGFLSVADKRDSQDICFTQKQHYSSLVNDLSSGLSSSKGEIVHVDGRVLGYHNGIANFTVGQRRGLGVSIGEALYVVRIDVLTSRVIVGPYSALKVRFLWLREANWLGDISPLEFPIGGIKLAARIRSTCPVKPVLLLYNDSIFKVEFPEGEYGIAIGQACALYSDQHPESRMLGGGFIADSE